MATKISKIILFRSIVLLLILARLVCCLGNISSFVLPKQLENRAVVVTGQIVSIPTAGTRNSQRFYFLTDSLAGKKSDRKLRLASYGHLEKLCFGDRWQLLVKLKRPHGFADPGVFNYRHYLYSQGVSATGYVKPSSINRQISSKWYNGAIGRLRQIIVEQIEHLFGNEPVAGVIIALVVGYRGEISQQQWQMFRSSGTSHLVAISGLHIGLMFGFGYLFALFVLKQFGLFILSRMPAKEAATIFGLVAATIYALLSGFSLPTQRALIMLTTFVVAMLSRRRVSAWLGLLLAFILVLIINPFALFSASFFLSFSAVAILIYSFTGRINVAQRHRVIPDASVSEHVRDLFARSRILSLSKLASSPKQTTFRDDAEWLLNIKPIHYLLSSNRVQIVIIIGLFPLNLLMFHQFSLVSLLANLVAIPLFSFVVIPLSITAISLLLMSKSLAKLLLVVAAKVLHLVWIYLTWLTHFHWSVYHYSFNNSWLLATTIITILLLLAPRGMPGKWLAAIFILPLLCAKSIAPQYGGMNFTLLDVGQGLASVVETRHHLLVYDTGPKFSDAFDAGKAVLVPFIRYLHRNRVDMLVVSHGDSDHIGGAASLLTRIPATKILTSVPGRFHKNVASYCHVGQTWIWDGVTFSILHPQYRGFWHGNNGSCVLKITAGKRSVLLTGDIQSAAESDVIKSSKNKLKATILIAPHHGSITSSTNDFVNTVAPKYALFPVGYLNRFHFPNPKVLMRYRREHAVILSTAKSGALTFSIGHNGKISLRKQLDGKLHILSFF